MTILVTYYEYTDATHPLLDDTKQKKSKVVEVDNLTEVNGLFENVIDVKVLR